MLKISPLNLNHKVIFTYPCVRSNLVKFRGPFLSLSFLFLTRDSAIYQRTRKSNLRAVRISCFTLGCQNCVVQTLSLCYIILHRLLFPVLCVAESVICYWMFFHFLFIHSHAWVVLFPLRHEGHDIEYFDNFSCVLSPQCDVILWKTTNTLMCSLQSRSTQAVQGAFYLI